MGLNEVGLHDVRTMLGHSMSGLPAAIPLLSEITEALTAVPSTNNRTAAFQETQPRDPLHFIHICNIFPRQRIRHQSFL